MRILIGTLVATVTLVGCVAPSDVALEHRSEQNVQARGVALNESGAVANVGMYSTTCTVATEFGTVQQDYNYEDSNEDTVVDSATLNGVGSAHLVLTPGNVNVTTPDLFPVRNSFALDGVSAAGFINDGFVAVRPVGDHCEVQFTELVAEQSSVVDASFSCGAAVLTTDFGAGIAFIGGESGIFKVTRDGAVSQVAETADALVSFDNGNEVLFVAEKGGNKVSALDLSGAALWESTLEGAVLAIEAVGSTGRVAVSLATSDGLGEFLVLEAGQITADLTTPSAATELSVSGDGQVLAVTLPGAVHYFDILAQ